MASSCSITEHARRTPRAPPSEEAFERAAGIFRAAGDVARLKLLARLSEGEWCVSELAESSGAAVAAVSQQLGVLRAQHIVRHRRAGKHIYYSLHDQHVIEMVQNALEHAAEGRRSPDMDEKGKGRDARAPVRVYRFVHPTRSP